MKCTFLPFSLHQPPLRFSSCSSLHSRLYSKRSLRDAAEPKAERYLKSLKSRKILEHFINQDEAAIQQYLGD